MVVGARVGDGGMREMLLERCDGAAVERQAAAAASHPRPLNAAWGASRLKSLFTVR